MVSYIIILLNCDRTNLAFDRVAFTVYDSIGRDDAVGRRISLHHLELDGTHTTANHEGVIAMNRPVCLHEVRLQVYFKQVAVNKR